MQYKDLFRYTKVDRIYHHQIPTTRNVKGNPPERLNKKQDPPV